MAASPYTPAVTQLPRGERPPDQPRDHPPDTSSRVPASPHSDAAIIVGDAHFGHTPDSPSDQLFPAFLRRVPSMAGHLVILGDLFDFWFEYRSVIPRAAFPVLSALHEMRQTGVHLTVIGGNHDRWGGRFWREQLQGDFVRDSGEVEVAGFRAMIHHGDGLTEQHRASRIMHRVTRHPATAATFRLIHPDLGFWLVKRMSRLLAESTRDGPVLDRAARAQADYAARLLRDRADLGLVILGHTHRAALDQHGDRRWYVNPGSWMHDRRYALVAPSGPELRTFDA